MATEIDRRNGWVDWGRAKDQPSTKTLSRPLRPTDCSVVVLLDEDSLARECLLNRHRYNLGILALIFPSQQRTDLGLSYPSQSNLVAQWIIEMPFPLRDVSGYGDPLVRC